MVARPITFAEIKHAPDFSLDKPHLEEVDGGAFSHGLTSTRQDASRGDVIVVDKVEELDIDAVRGGSKAVGAAESV